MDVRRGGEGGDGRRRAGGDFAGAAVVDRAFAVLRAFDAEHRALGLAELSRRTGLPRSTALRMARRLVAAGALERRGDGRYVIGLGLLEIATLAPRGHGLRAVAMPYLEDLFHVIRRHVLLAVLDEEEALLVERLSAPEAGPVRFRVGGRMPLHAGGAGLVLLAFAPAATQERALRRFTAGESVDALRDAEDLRRLLAEVRRGDYAVGSRSLPYPRATAAAPVRGPSGAVVAALSVVGPLDGFDPSAWIPAVRATARAVSRRLAEDEVPE
ncbi:IclR family transcriptional regulator [Streptomyces sp. NPDC059740]|uniref:IclR family transcriptional regulator n=1 Tax=Streptomyces sp. NPDC059740 TaxID=3346926 RepID=UPI0036533EFC